MRVKRCPSVDLYTLLLSNALFRHKNQKNVEYLQTTNRGRALLG